MSPAGDSGYFPGRPGNDESKHSSSSGSSGSSSSHSTQMQRHDSNIQQARQDASATAADLEKHEHPIVNCQLSAQETLPTGTSCRSSMSMPMWLASRHTHKTSACCSPPCGGFCTSTRLSLVQEVFQAPTVAWFTQRISARGRSRRCTEPCRRLVQAVLQPGSRLLSL